MNLFALLAEEQAHSQQAAKKAAAPAAAAGKAPNQELTPKARAEAKAQETERKKKVAQQSKSVEVDASELSGFSLQRNQRVKEKRLAPQEPPKETNNKGGFKGDKKPFKGDRQNKDKTPAGDNAVIKGDKPFKENNRQAKGFKSDKPKPAFKADGNDNRPPRRDGFDKQSQGKFSRQPYAKKQGHGKGNWGDDVEAPAVTKTEETAEETAPVATDDGWGTTTEETQTAAEGDAEAPVETTEEKEPEPVELSLDDYFKIQAEKKKELEAKVGAVREGPRSLTEEEKRNLQKFTFVENAKAATPAKEPKAQKEVVQTKNARKGEKPVAVDAVFNVSVASGQTGREDRGPRGEGRGRGGRGGRRPQGEKRDGQAGNDQRGPRPAKGPGRGGKAQKIVRNDTQFPSLG